MTTTPDQSPDQSPATYADGLGETLRALRVYMGLSRVLMANELKIREDTYRKIEAGTRDMPPGLLDAAQEIRAEFDEDVKALDPGVHKVTADRDGGSEEWQRAIVNHASVVREGIVPVLLK